MALVTQKPLVPYYVVNIADERIPFTGVIGMSNVVAPEGPRGVALPTAQVCAFHRSIAAAARTKSYARSF
jgi:hypothetical protein